MAAMATPRGAFALGARCPRAERAFDRRAHHHASPARSSSSSRVVHVRASSSRFDDHPRGDAPGSAVLGFAVAAAASVALSVVAHPPSALAGTPKGQGVLSTSETGTAVDRCSVEALKKGAGTRAAFSDFATQQNQELYVNVEGCDFSNLDLSGEVLSGIKALSLIHI